MGMTRKWVFAALATAAPPTARAVALTTSSSRAGAAVVVAAAVVARGSVASSSDPPDDEAADESGQLICGEGYYQKEYVTLSCDGGHGRKFVMLTHLDTTDRVFYWRAPKGTRDLRMTAHIEPREGELGATQLIVKCEHGEKQMGAHSWDLVAAKGGVLNQSVRSAQIQHANWSWSGDPEPQSQSYTQFLQIRGDLGCDIQVLLINSEASTLAADVQYSWSRISPCPEHITGCEPCPDDVCQEDEVARCDGGRYWECVTDDGWHVAMAATSTTSTADAPVGTVASGSSTTSLRTATSASTLSLSKAMGPARTTTTSSMATTSTSSTEATSATSTATTGTSMTAEEDRPLAADVKMVIAALSFEKLNDMQKKRVERSVVKDLARSLNLPEGRITDLDGNPEHVTLSQGSLVGDCVIYVPAGMTIEDVQHDLNSTARELIAKGVASLPEIEKAVVNGGTFAGGAREVTFFVAENTDVQMPRKSANSSGSKGNWGTLAVVFLTIGIVGAIAAAAFVVLRIVKRTDSTVLKGEHQFAQTPVSKIPSEQPVNREYSNAHDEERQRLIPAGSPGGNGPLRNQTPGHRSNSNRRLGKGWPPGYEPLQRDTGA